jgi:protein phosphatase 2C family protein 2/3
VFPFPIYQNGKELEPPFRVTPGNLSVSRTIGDVRAKVERLGGKKGVVVSTPDVNVVNLDDKCNAIVICCDGVFDVMDNNDIVSCVIKAKEGKGEWDSNIICAEAANLIIKMAIEKESFDNVSCIVIGLNLWGD